MLRGMELLISLVREQTIWSLLGILVGTHVERAFKASFFFSFQVEEDLNGWETGLYGGTSEIIFQ